MANKEQEAFVRRLDIAAKRVGSLYALAKAAGLDTSSLYDYRRKGTEPSRGNLVALAVAAGVSVEWLATGKDSAGLDSERLRDAIEGVETWLKLSRRKMTPAEKAEVIAEIYEEVLKEESTQAGAASEPRPARILRLVGKLRA